MNTCWRYDSTFLQGHFNEQLSSYLIGELIVSFFQSTFSKFYKAFYHHTNLKDKCPMWNRFLSEVLRTDSHEPISSKVIQLLTLSPKTCISIATFQRNWCNNSPRLSVWSAISMHKNGLEMCPFARRRRIDWQPWPVSLHNLIINNA